MSPPSNKVNHKTAFKSGKQWYHIQIKETSRDFPSYQLSIFKQIAVPCVPFWTLDYFALIYCYTKPSFLSVVITIRFSNYKKKKLKFFNSFLANT